MFSAKYYYTRKCQKLNKFFNNTFQRDCSTIQSESEVFFLLHFFRLYLMRNRCVKFCLSHDFRYVCFRCFATIAGCSANTKTLSLVISSINQLFAAFLFLLVYLFPCFSCFLKLSVLYTVRPTRLYSSVPQLETGTPKLLVWRRNE